MLIHRLKVSDVRNIAHADLQFNHPLAIITGKNGAGKSSIIEALSILSTGRSFRSSSIQQIIRSTRTDLSVFAKGVNCGATYSAGILRNQQGQFKAKLNGENLKRQYELTEHIPVFSIVPGIYEEIANQRKARMRLLDWGVFHVEHQFFATWRDYKQALRQRNAVLKQIKLRKALPKSLDYWESSFVALAERLTEIRSRYVERLQPYFNECGQRFGELLANKRLVYKQGFSQGMSYSEVLEKNKENDIKRGFTQAGPHRGDFILLKGNENVFDFVSRGQQKVLINALMLSVIALFTVTCDKECLVCIDDLPSELDLERQEQLIAALTALERTQLLVTAITEDSLPGAISGYNRDMFHVEQGEFRVQKDLKQ